METATARIELAFLDTRKRLIQLIKRRVGCPETAEDLVQEAYLRLIQHNSLADIADLPAYLFRIASNLAIDHRRRAAAATEYDCEPLDEDLVCPQPHPNQAAETSQELEILARLIGELPPQCKRIFLLHRVENLSYAEIAVRLNISPRTVEAQVGKALKILRSRTQS